VTTGLSNTLTGGRHAEHRATAEASVNLSLRSDAWLVARAKELLARSVNYPDSTINSLDELLRETRKRENPVARANLLRATAIARLASNDSDSTLAQADQLLEELLEHAQRHQLLPHRANAHAIRGRRWLAAGELDTALTEIAKALAILDTDTGFTSRDRTKAHVCALLDCWLGLNDLGAFEAAETIIQRAAHTLRQISDPTNPTELTIILTSQVRTLLNWGMRLERAGKPVQAKEKFTAAASIAGAACATSTPSLSPNTPFPNFTAKDPGPYTSTVDSRADPTEGPTVRRSIPETAPKADILTIALAFRNPGKEHVLKLENLISQQKYSPLTTGEDRALTAIALARSVRLSENGRDKAITTLITIRDELANQRCSPPTKLNLLREIAEFSQSRSENIDGQRLSNPLNGSGFSEDPFKNYAAALEEELWALRTLRITALTARCEHEKLSAKHGVVAQQALQDPLTGLPNRRALDGYLAKMATSPENQPLAIALVDLDGFKEVNDRNSHAEGDKVLRVIARTMHASLRGEDVVARYGGDEFIVLLPKTAEPEARHALGRALKAVASLPGRESHGVTLSAGLVCLTAQESLREAVSRADKAMYLAKGQGGNQIAETPVCLPSFAPIPEEPLWPREELDLPAAHPAACTEIARIPINQNESRNTTEPAWPQEEPAWPESDPESSGERTT
jgi:diguanylate cyclase (GGDEF)-like protein